MNWGNVVLLHNSKQDIVEFISTLICSGFLRTNDWLVFVDNASSDGTLVNLKRVVSQTGLDSVCNVHIIPLSENVGYARGNNVGIDFLLDKVDWISVINPDVRWDKTMGLYRSIKKDSLTVYSPRIKSSQGEESARGRFTLKELICEALIIPYDRNTEAPSVPHGSFFTMNTKLWQQVKFDSNTFLYYEEDILIENLSTRFQEIKCKVISDAQVVHIGATTTSKKASKELLDYRLKSFIYYVQNYSKYKYSIIGIIITLLAKLRNKIYQILSD